MSRIRPLIGRGTVPFAAFAVGRPAGPLEPVLDVHTERLSRTIGEIGTLTLDRVLYPGLDAEPYYDIEVEAAADLVDPKPLRAVEAELPRWLRAICGRRAGPSWSGGLTSRAAVMLPTAEPTDRNAAGRAFRPAVSFTCG